MAAAAGPMAYARPATRDALVNLENILFFICDLRNPETVLNHRVLKLKIGVTFFF